MNAENRQQNDNAGDVDDCEDASNANDIFSIYFFFAARVCSGSFFAGVAGANGAAGAPTAVIRFV